MKTRSLLISASLLMAGCAPLAAYKDALSEGDSEAANRALGEMAAVTGEVARIGADVASLTGMSGGITGIGVAAEAVIGTLGALGIAIFGKKAKDKMAANQVTFVRRALQDHADPAKPAV